MPPLAEDDYGREYTLDELERFRKLVAFHNLATVPVDQFMSLRSCPGLLGSTLLEVQRRFRARLQWVEWFRDACTAHRSTYNWDCMDPLASAALQEE